MDVPRLSTSANPNRTVRWLMVRVGSQQIIYSDPSVIPALTRCTTDKAIPKCCVQDIDRRRCRVVFESEKTSRRVAANACLMGRPRIMGTRTMSIIQKKKERDVRHFSTRQDSISCAKMIFMSAHAKQKRTDRARLFKYFCEAGGRVRRCEIKSVLKKASASQTKDASV